MLSYIICSMLCGGNDGISINASMRSRAVSVAAQKKAGDSAHPIWRLWGTTSRMLSMFVAFVEGRV
jgi:hypothetical protein